jgi:hypothetical protein
MQIAIDFVSSTKSGRRGREFVLIVGRRIAFKWREGNVLSFRVHRVE